MAIRIRDTIYSRNRDILDLCHARWRSHEVAAFGLLTCGDRVSADGEQVLAERFKAVYYYILLDNLWDEMWMRRPESEELVAAYARGSSLELSS